MAGPLRDLRNLRILTILKDGETLKSQTIESEVDLGRGEACVIRLDDRAISRQHAIFRPTADGIQVEKKSNFAPMLVNGSDCTSAMIREGDVISIGPYLMRLSLSKSQAQPQVQAEATPSSQPKAEAEPMRDAAAALDSNTVPLSSPKNLGHDHSPTDGDLQNDFKNHLQGTLQVSTDSEPPPNLEAPHLDEPRSDSSQPQVGLDLGQDLDLDINPGYEPDLPQSPGPQPESPSKSGTFGDAGMPGDDEQTRPGGSFAIKTVLVFEAGVADVEEFELKGKEVSIGREKGCDVVLNDKKASRKHAIFKKIGARYRIKDLASANGTFVNGERLTEERELSGEDEIKIGNSKFYFKAVSANYAVKEKDFLKVPEPQSHEEPSEQRGDFGGIGQLLGGFPPVGGSSGMENAPVDMGPMSPVGSSAHYQQPQGYVPHPNSQPMAGPLSGQAHSSNINGHATQGIGFQIPGINMTSKKRGIVDRFKELNTKRKVIWLCIVAALVWYLVFDEDEPAKKPKTKISKKADPQTSASPVPKVSGSPQNMAAFESLTEEQKQFVIGQHKLAFDYYKNKEYEKALFELQKIFALIPDYKDAREIERYAREGKIKREAIEEEKKKKAEEERQKAKLEQLLIEAGAKMKRRQYVQVKEVFSQILAMDPENVLVPGWRKEVDDYEESLRKEAQIKEVQKITNEHAWDRLKSGISMKESGNCHSAIEVFEEVPQLGALDKRPSSQAKELIKACREFITAQRDPLLKQGKESETAGDFPKAFQFFKKATLADPPHPDGYVGMDRIRKVLHERAKISYTEAILAESYSDFKFAEKKYKEVLEIAPEDDIYHERALRKLSNYFKKAVTEEEAPR